MSINHIINVKHTLELIIITIIILCLFALSDDIHIVLILFGNFEIKKKEVKRMKQNMGNERSYAHG